MVTGLRLNLRGRLQNCNFDPLLMENRIIISYLMKMISSQGIITLAVFVLTVIGIAWSFQPLMIIYIGPESGFYPALKKQNPIRLVDIEPYIRGEIDDDKVGMWWELREFKLRILTVLGLFLCTLVTIFTLERLKIKDNQTPTGNPAPPSS
jgi:hypothetical protein